MPVYKSPLDTYSHVAPGLQEAAAALFDKGLAPRVNPKPANISQEISQLTFQIPLAIR